MEEDKTAPEVALYLTFLAYKSGGLAAVRTALCALRYYAKLQGEEGNYMKDPLIETVVGEKKWEEILRKISRGLEKQGKVKKKIEEKVKWERLLLRAKRTGTGAEDYQALPPRQ